jgi:hypothetical protein
MSLSQQHELQFPQEAKETRMVRVELNKKQIALLVDYAIRNGYKKKHPQVDNMDLTEQNLAAKYAIMNRLGFN